MSLTLADYIEITNPTGAYIYPSYGGFPDIPQYETKLFKPIKRTDLLDLYDKTVLSVPLDYNQKMALESMKIKSGQPYELTPEGQLKPSFRGVDVMRKYKRVGLRTKKFK